VEEQAVRQTAELAREILQTLIDKMNLRASVRILEASPTQIMLDIEGGQDLGIIIGRQGQTLNALQLVTSVVANKRAGTRYRILLDASGYRARRAQALRLRAFEVAEQVKATGKEALLESLKAHERRIVHLALANDPDVYTYSEGEGERRNLVISPRD